MRSGAVKVGVPLNQGNGSVAVDSGQSFNFFGS